MYYKVYLERALKTASVKVIKDKDWETVIDFKKT